MSQEENNDKCSKLLQNGSVTSDQASPVPVICNPAANVTSEQAVPLTIDLVVPVTSDPVIPVASVQVPDDAEPVESENPTLKFSRKLSLEDRKRRYVFCIHIQMFKLANGPNN